MSQIELKLTNVLRSKTLTDFRASPVKMVYHVPQGMANLWAPELHAIGGNLYIYFAMDDGNNDYHRMYVIKAYDPSNPMGDWGPAKRSSSMILHFRFRL